MFGELLYAFGLILVGETVERLGNGFIEWKGVFESEVCELVLGLSG